MAMEIDSCCVNAVDSKVSGPGVVGPSFGSEMLRICAWRASWTSINVYSAVGQQHFVLLMLFLLQHFWLLCTNFVVRRFEVATALLAILLW